MLEENNQENQNETGQENPPPQQTKKKLKKSRSLLLREHSKYIAPILLNFNIEEKNKKLEEMLSDLELFRCEYKENQEKNIINSGQDNTNTTTSTKLFIFNALEKNLIEISCINNKEIRSNRLNILYLWYKERNKISEDLRKINVNHIKK
jgi:hypothetical protein